VNAATLETWYRADEGEVNRLVRQHVATVEERQFDLYNKFVRLEALYDPNAPSTRGQVQPSNGGQMSNTTVNVIAQNVDTVTAMVANSNVRTRFMTDDADWSIQRRAKHLEWYCDGLTATHDIDGKCRLAFRDCALKGTGIIKVVADADKQICVNLVMVDDIVVDESETRGGKQAPKQIHERVLCNRDELIAEYPEYEDEIRRADSTQRTRLWAGYRPVGEDQLVVLESFRKPIGRKGKRGYVPGRHTKTIEGFDLLDEEWDDDEFPYVRIVWSERNGWYGIGLAERLAGIQNTLNKRLWQVDRLLNQGAAPTTYVDRIDQSMVVKTEMTGRASIVPYSGRPPVTVAAPIVNPETYRSIETLEAQAQQEAGVSAMVSQAAKPAGLDSGEALRQYHDKTTIRFSTQEKAFEDLKLAVILAVLRVCKKLGADAPTICNKTRWGRRTIEWSKVDMGDLKVQIAAASELPKTPAGRTQTVLEWAQAGIISQDAARRLLDHPDIEREMSIVNAAIESVDWCLERIKDGELVVPEPYMNLDLCVYRGQMEYLRIQGDGAPEEILENLRTFITQAAYKLAPPANANMPAAAPGMDPGAAGAMPPGMGAPAGAAPGPVGAAAMPQSVPQAALSPQAMQLLSA
jgi:hypothetical protein